MLPKELSPLGPFLHPLQHLRDQINRLPDKIIHLTESIKQLFIRPDISQRIENNLNPSTVTLPLWHSIHPSPVFLFLP